jgi:hypothetical protein
MLLTKEHFSQLKKVQNVSKDAEKTKERVATDFKAAARAVKVDIVELTGQVESSIYRVYKEGSANARIVLAISQVLKVNPFYYSGEIDEREPLEETQIAQFLKANGYDDLLKEASKPAKRKYERKPKTEPLTTATEIQEESAEMKTAVSASSADNDLREADKQPSVKPDTTELKEVNLSFANDSVMIKAVEDLTEQEAAELLHTLFIRAKGGGEAALLLDVVKRCLIK